MSDVPQEPGGWWHDFVCPTHGRELSGPEGDAFVGACGCTLSGDKIRGAWLALEHQALARAARLHARRFTRHGDSNDRNAAITLVSDYAGLYARIEAEGWSESAEPWMLQGKLFAQALSEAQWAVAMADAVIELAAEPAVRDSAAVRSMLASIERTMVDARHALVVERGDFRNNYTAWLDAAIRLVGLATHAIGGPAPEPRTLTAVYEHITAAVMSDGWEWEASTYYHLFVLRAYLLSLRGVAPAQVPSDIAKRLRDMVDVFVVLATPDGRLPMLHDGPYDRVAMHREVCEVAALASQFWVESGLEQVERYARTAMGTADDGLEVLLDGWSAGPALTSSPTTRGSHLFADAGYVVLSDDSVGLHAVLDAGPHGGAHGHYDTLGLYLYGRGAAWQPAPGVPPYGSPLRHGYYATSRAHPTVRIDGAEQQQGSGQIAEWDPHRSAVRATTVDALPGAAVTRTLRLAGQVLLDVVSVQCTDAKEHEIELGLCPASDLDITCGDGGWTTRWGAADEPPLVGMHRAAPAGSLASRPARGPSDNPAQVVAGAQWKVEGTSAVFASAWHLSDGGAPNCEITFHDGAVAFTVATPKLGPTTTEVPL